MEEHRSAAELFRELIAILRRERGAGYPSLLVPSRELATALYELGEDHEAEVFFREALAIARA